MKNNTLINASIALLSLASLSHAGPSSTETEIPTSKDPDFLSFSGDVRTRYEFREMDGQDPSHALTARGRLGLTLGDFNGFSAFIEGEATESIIDDFRSNPTGSNSTDPYVVGNTPIGDPDNAELNRAWVQYKKNDFFAKVGRQRIIRNNAAFIGNVGWRQNEQTFDAAQIGYSDDKFSISYAYSDRVQRIFGDDANDALPGPPLRDFEGDFHLLDSSYNIDCGTIGGYLYLIDVDNNVAVGENNTLGVFYKSDSFHLEVAGQDGTSDLVNGNGDYDAFYGHAVYTKKLNASSISFGVEYLEENFKTPFATVHAFNGFADAFVLNRIGLTNSGGSYEGITDFYLDYTKKGLPCGLVFKGIAHYFMDDSIDETYGYEVDAVLIKAFTPDLKGILKAAYFNADSDSSYSDIKQVSLGLNYSF